MQLGVIRIKSNDGVSAAASIAEHKMARVVAELVREGVTFEVIEVRDDYEIRLTGGF